MSLNDFDLKNNKQILSFYTKSINDNHKIVIDHIKNSIDKLIAQLQQRENELLDEANRLRLSQLELLEKELELKPFNDISINKLEPPPNIFFDEATLDELLTKNSKFGQVIVSNNEISNWSQLKPINEIQSEKNEIGPPIEIDDCILKYVKSVLNKLNQSNYDKLNYDLTDYLSQYIENENLQIKISHQFIDMAMYQPNLFYNLYASLINSLIKSYELNLNGKKFRTNFLNGLQKKFESCCLNLNKSSQTYNKSQLLNLMGFIGELYKTGQLTNEIVVDCIYNLFFTNSKTNFDKIDETSLELGLKLLTCVDSYLSLDKSKWDSFTKLNIKLLKCYDLLDELLLYNSLNQTTSKKISSRLKFLIITYVEARSLKDK